MNKYLTFFFLLLSFSTLSLQTGYNETLANKLADICSIAYCPENQVVDWSCVPCRKWVDIKLMYIISQPVYSVFGFIAEMSEGIVFSFEGTQDVEDIMIDLQFVKTVPYKDHPTAKVHEGFWKAYSSVREFLLSVADKSQSTIFCTGHSLGAAMATLFSLDLQESLNKTCVMYNLGSPRVGNEAFGKLFSSTSINYRVTHWDDPVPHLPLKMMDFFHTGEEVWYNEDWSSKVFCSPEGKLCSDSRLIATNVHDHRFYFNRSITAC